MQVIKQGKEFMKVLSQANAKTIGQHIIEKWQDSADQKAADSHTSILFYIMNLHVTLSINPLKPGMHQCIYLA